MEPWPWVGVNGWWMSQMGLVRALRTLSQLPRRSKTLQRQLCPDSCAFFTVTDDFSSCHFLLYAVVVQERAAHMELV